MSCKASSRKCWSRRSWTMKPGWQKLNVRLFSNHQRSCRFRIECFTTDKPPVISHSIRSDSGRSVVCFWRPGLKEPYKEPYSALPRPWRALLFGEVARSTHVLRRWGRRCGPRLVGEIEELGHVGHCGVACSECRQAPARLNKMQISRVVPWACARRNSSSQRARSLCSARGWR